MERSAHVSARSRHPRVARIDVRLDAWGGGRWPTRRPPRTCPKRTLRDGLSPSRHPVREPEAGARCDRLAGARRGDRHLRPDGLGEDRGRGGRGRRARDRGRVRRRDAGLSRPPDPHEPAGAADASRRDPLAGRRDERRRVRVARARGDRRRSSSERRAAVVAGGTGLYLRAALADLGVPPPRRSRAQGPHRGGGRPRPGRRTRAPRLARSHHRRERPPERPAASRARARARGSGRDADAARGPALGQLDPTPDTDRRARGRERRAGATHPCSGRRRCSRAESSTRSERRSSSRCRAPRRRRSDCARSQSSSPADALERIVVRTRRYAAYQRKWMRRIPGIVLVEAARDPRPSPRDVLAHVRG